MPKETLRTDDKWKPKVHLILTQSSCHSQLYGLLYRKTKNKLKKIYIWLFLTYHFHFKHSQMLILASWGQKKTMLIPLTFHSYLTHKFTYFLLHVWCRNTPCLFILSTGRWCSSHWHPHVYEKNKTRAWISVCLWHNKTACKQKQSLQITFKNVEICTTYKDVRT